MNTEETPLEEIVSLAKKLIEIHSTEDNVSALNEAVLFVTKQLKNFTIQRFSVRNKPSLLIHNQSQDTKKFKIILNAHVDVVPGNKSQFEPQISNGKLYGRGAYDMKAATSVLIVLFKNFAKQVSYPLALQITTDEESGTFGAKKQVEEGYRAEFILTGECGSNLRITNRAKGIYRIKLIASGKVSHSAYPWEGENALLKLINTLTLISQRYPLPENESHKTTVNITMINTSNKAWNRTPDHAEADINIRFTQEDENILDEIQTLLPQDVIMEILSDYTYVPINTKPDNTYIQLIQQAGKKIIKHDIELHATHATSDLVRFVSVGCEGVEFGPIGANQHANNEWVDIKSLGDYYQILKQFLLSVK